MSGRLVAINPVDHPGGAETTLLRLLERLSRRGWQVTVTTPRDGPLAAQARASGYEHRPLPVGGIGRGQGARAIASFPRARRLAAQADVVYLNGAVTGRLSPALVGSGAETVLHVHDMVDRVPPFWRFADVVLAPSDAVARRLTGLAAHVVHPPAELDPPEVDPPWPPPAGPVIGFVGRLEPRKGVLDLLDAIPAVTAAEPAAHFVLIGDDPYGSDPDYTQRVLDGARAAGATLIPWIADAPSVMRHIDVLVLPSRQEPGGTVLAEAMAVGTPVVATAVDGLPEIVRDGVTGRLVPPADPAALAAAILDVLSRREEMGAAASEDALRFGADAYADRIEQLLASAGPAPSGPAPASR